MQRFQDADPTTAAERWFVRLRSEACSAGERKQFADWLEADPAHPREYAAVEALWHELDRLPVAAPPRRRTALPWAAAAMVVLALGAILLVTLTPETERTGKGELRSLTLPDGTRARLNSGTIIALDFSAGERRIELREGEALFEVAPDTNRPFLVQAGTAVIRDIGTRFDVSRQADRLRVAVTEGAVEIGDGARRCRLDAGFAAILAAAGECAIAPVNAGSLAWLDGRVIFDGAPLQEVAEEFNRHQHTPLRLDGAAVAQLHLSGTFRIDRLEQLPPLLPRLLPVAVEKSDGAWVVRPAGAPAAP